MAKKYQITFDSDTEQSVVDGMLTQAGFTATVENLDAPANTDNQAEAKTAEKAA